MSDFSGTREEKTLQNIIEDGVQVALHTGDEGNTPDGSNEATGTDLPRADVPEDEFSISSSEGPTTLSNDNVIDFGEASGDIGDVTHFSLWTDYADGAEAETSTVEISNLPSTGHHTITAGEEVKIPADDLTVEID